VGAPVVTIAWLQKHPSPTATDGAFHWHPERVDGDEDRALRTRFVERLRGVTAPAVLWLLEADRVAWATVWAAVSPVDGRRYTGMTLAVAGDLAAIEPPPAGPYGAGVAVSGTGDPVAIARALLGSAEPPRVAGIDPHQLAAIDRRLPPSVRARSREGVVAIDPHAAPVIDDPIAAAAVRGELCDADLVAPARAFPVEAPVEDPRLRAAYQALAIARRRLHVMSAIATLAIALAIVFATLFVVRAPEPALLPVPPFDVPVRE